MQAIIKVSVHFSAWLEKPPKRTVPFGGIDGNFCAKCPTERPLSNRHRKSK
jgi:hypothetical protein